MKHIRHLAMCLLLVLSLATSAFAAEVPEELVVENLNGQQRMVKTYVLPPDADPETLKEPSFEYDGFTYSWAYTTKEEMPYLDTKDMVQTVTVETAKKDLADVLAALSPTLAYDDGEYTGELSLDHTTLVTEAAGYTTKYSKTTETKTIGPLDRNDMSYVPATTVKNGKTLSLANVEWQVISTALVGEALVPSQYQAIATYSASSSYQAATGYVTTAEYHGEVVSEGIESIVYTVVYTGEEIVPVETIPEPDSNPLLAAMGDSPVFAIGAVMLAALLIAALVLLFLRRKNVIVYVPGDRPRDYKVIAKFRVDSKYPEIDLGSVEPYPAGIVAIEVKKSLAKEMVGQEFTIHCRDFDHTFEILSDQSDYWHEFSVEITEEVTS